MSNRQNEIGFSLLELFVSLAIASVVLAAFSGEVGLVLRHLRVQHQRAVLQANFEHIRGLHESLLKDSKRLSGLPLRQVIPLAEVMSRSISSRLGIRYRRQSSSSAVLYGIVRPESCWYVSASDALRYRVYSSEGNLRPGNRIVLGIWADGAMLIDRMQVSDVERSSQRTNATFATLPESFIEPLYFTSWSAGVASRHFVELQPLLFVEIEDVYTLFLDTQNTLRLASTSAQQSQPVATSVLSFAERLSSLEVSIGLPNRPEPIGHYTIILPASSVDPHQVLLGAARWD